MPEIERAIQSRIAFNRNEEIVHVQIEKNGRLAFVAYDQFDEVCVTAIRPAVPVSLLEELVQKKILHSFEAGQLAIVVGIPLERRVAIAFARRPAAW